MMLAYQPVRTLATLNMGIHQGISAARRILPIIESKKNDKNANSELKFNKGNIEFKQISFKYESSSNNILDKIDLKINSNEMTALVGHSGAGKSTIMNLIPRFYEPLSGSIFIDNQLIYNHSIKSLRENISLVSQDTTLFDDTIKNNIKYSKINATDNEINEVAKLSHCDDFIGKMHNGYDT